MLGMASTRSRKWLLAGTAVGALLLAAIGVEATSASAKQDRTSQFTNTSAAAAQISKAGGLAAVEAQAKQSPPAINLPKMPSIVNGQSAAAPAAAADGAGTAPLTGILNETHDSPFQPGIFQVTNKWVGPVNGVNTYAVAGEDLKTNEGSIGIFTAPTKVTDVSQIKLVGLYDEPGTKSVTITAASGNTLTLSHVGGSGDLTFNMATHTFAAA